MWDEWASQIMGDSGANSGNMYQNYANAGVINASPEQFAGDKAVIQANEEEKQRSAAAAAAKAKAALEEQREADKKDPNKAKMVLREDRSGYDFFNGVGDKMNINQFSLLTGMKPDQILKDSDNPRDQKFIKDYTTMRDLSSAWVNGDTEILAKARAADPERFNQLMSQFRSPNEMVKGFMDYYSDYYGNTENSMPQDAPLFSVGNKVAPTKDEWGLLSGTNADTITTPTIAEPPEYSDNWFKRNLFESMPGLNRLSGQRDARRRYQEMIDENPWRYYQNSLLGGNRHYKSPFKPVK